MKSVILNAKNASAVSSLHSLGPQVLGGGQLSILLLHSGIGVQLEHGADVLQGVGLHHRTLHLPVGGPEHLPDGLALEESRQVSVSHLGLGQVPAVLDRAGLTPGSVETIKLLESSLGPNAESADMTTGGELQEV